MKHADTNPPSFAYILLDLHSTEEKRKERGRERGERCIKSIFWCFDISLVCVLVCGIYLDAFTGTLHFEVLVF